MVFDISMGLRRDDRALRREINAVLERRKQAINSILEQFGVPLISEAAASHASAPASDHSQAGK